ncbi:MAG TPA: hypothetical protein VFA45_20415 [Actinomycetes bacterium]|nr:hypothetical protein [Actinomycetes bacterium]
MTPEIKRMLDGYRVHLARRGLDFLVANDQRAAIIRAKLEADGVTDMTSAALGWLENLTQLTNALQEYGPIPAPMAAILDKMSAVGLAILDAEQRSPEPEPVVPGLDHAVHAAEQALRQAAPVGDLLNVARIAVEAAWGTFAQPLAEPAWELERLRHFETWVRQRAKSAVQADVAAAEADDLWRSRKRPGRTE